MALAKKTSVLREATLWFVEPARSALNNSKSVPRRVCRHFLKPCSKSCCSGCLFVTHYTCSDSDSGKSAALSPPPWNTILYREIRERSGRDPLRPAFSATVAWPVDSTFCKGGCSGNRVEWFVCCCILVYYIILPQSTAPPIHCTPLCRVSSRAAVRLREASRDLVHAREACFRSPDIATNASVRRCCRQPDTGIPAQSSHETLSHESWIIEHRPSCSGRHTTAAFSTVGGIALDAASLSCSVVRWDQQRDEAVPHSWSLTSTPLHPCFTVDSQLRGKAWLRKTKPFSEQLPNHRHRNLKAFEEHLQTHVFCSLRRRSYM